MILHLHDQMLDLSTLPLFHNLPAALLSLITQNMVHMYSDEDVLFHQGDAADNVIVLLHGQVRLYTNNIYIAARQPYQVIGEQAYLDQTTRSAKAIAQGHVMALVLPRVTLEQLMQNAIFVQNLLHIVSDKLREATAERSLRYRNEQLLFGEFRAHLSPQVTQRLLLSGQSYGEPRYIDAVILFSDIRSFTERSAGMTSEAIAQQLTAYFDAIVDVIHQHGGLVDKFIGDAVMAVWGFTPSEGDKDITSEAFACAQTMVHTAAKMQFGSQPIRIGIGLNAGQVFIGNVGGEGKRQFTVLGSPVNLAARYESQAKHLNAPIVMGQAFYDRLPSDVQADVMVHPDQAIKGAEQQALYTYDSTRTVGQGV